MFRKSFSNTFHHFGIVKLENCEEIPRSFSLDQLTRKLIFRMRNKNGRFQREHTANSDIFAEQYFKLPISSSENIWSIEKSPQLFITNLYILLLIIIVRVFKMLPAIKVKTKCFVINLLAHITSQYVQIVIISIPVLCSNTSACVKRFIYKQNNKFVAKTSFPQTKI